MSSAARRRAQAEAAARYEQTAQEVGTAVMPAEMQPVARLYAQQWRGVRGSVMRMLAKSPLDTRCRAAAQPMNVFPRVHRNASMFSLINRLIFSVFSNISLLL